MEMKVWMGLVAAFVAGVAAAEPVIGSENGARVISVPAGEDYTLSAADVTALGASVDLVKRGAGRLVIATDLKTAGWGGELRVEEGYLRVRAVGALGTTAKGTVVADGATLEIDGSVTGANKLNFAKESLTICGEGVTENGMKMGVIRNVANDQWPGIAPVTMTGDCLYATTKAGSNRFDFRSGTVNMNGHTLTTRGYFAFTLAKVENPGHIVVEEGTFVIENGNTFNGDAANTFTLGAGTTLYLRDSLYPIPWKLVMNDGAKLQSTLGTKDTSNVWAGPVELVSGTAKFLALAYSTPLWMTGDISGAGALQAANENGTLWLSGANTFTGGLKLTSNATHVIVARPESLPTSGEILLCGNSATLELPVGDDEDADSQAWGLEAFKQVAQRAQVTGGGAGVLLRNAAGETRTFAENVTGANVIGHAGAGTLALTGDWLTGEADLSNKDGEITVPNGNDLHVRFLDVNGGTLRIKSGGLVYSHTNAYLGARWPQTARIIAENGGCYMASNESYKSVYPMTIGRSRLFNGTYHRGLMDIQSGASLTGRICVGFNLASTDAAALYVRPGANFYSTGMGNSCDMYVGNVGSGYVELAGDTYMKGWTMVGVGNNGRGVWVQTGGTAKIHSDAFSLGATGARGEAYFSGGTFTAEKEIHVGKSVWSPAGQGSHAAFTVTGDAEVICWSAMDIAAQSNCLAAVNLNGGSLQTAFIQKIRNLKEQMVTQSGNIDMTLVGNTGFVNFGGGTLKAYADGPLIKPQYAPDKVTVNAGGACVDTAGHACSLDVPIEAPRGKGVAGVPLPAACSVPWNYIGSPYVTITGDGTNAWAHAVFDSERGVVTGIVITNPGEDYTWATATLAYGGWTNEVTVTDLPLADNRAGGFTKKGDGTLTLNAANEFAGNVTVAGGTLVAAHADALPTAFDLAVTGGTLDGGGHAYTVGTLNATSGSVCNVVAGTTVGSLTKTGDGVFGLDAKVPVAGPVRVLGGTLRLPQTKRGLWEGVRTYENQDSVYKALIAGQVFVDTFTDDYHYLHTWFYTTDAAPTSKWREEMYVTYSGYIWNTADSDRTWRFGALLDDATRIYIDGAPVVLQSGYATPAFGKVTVTPGPHRIVIALANYSSGGGATGANGIGWTRGHAVIWRPDCDPDAEPSTAYADYYDIADPEHGAMLTGTLIQSNDDLPAVPAVEVAAGATLDAGDGLYAFTSYKGLGNVTGSVSIQNWTIDGAEVAAGAVMHVTGDLTFPAGAAFTLLNHTAVPENGKAVTIATVDGTVNGQLAPLTIPGSGVWSVYPSGKDLKLGLLKGTLLILK